MVMQKLQVFVWIMAGLVLLASLLIGSRAAFLSAGMGCLLMIFSFYALYLSVWLLNSGKKYHSIFGFLIFALKLAVLGLLLWLIIIKIPIHIPAFLIGLGTIFFAIFVYGIYSLFLERAKNA